ncbi:MAG: leucine--tRNA ligase [Microscillaceae bacterium]|jgi:leucyl-tRNA synthetase|nr:leucine--tRNA ligase [Microscillaceae bacterium]
MEYNPQETEPKWQQYWLENETYRVDNQLDKPKYYILDMFPYPSGAGLHVGHPLGYIATDIFARYKRMKGFNVLHPMGFDSFGLPAEQYAIDTGQHPAITTAQNIATFKKQLAKIGFNYDWSREVQTSSPDFYKWTQWIFQQIFKSWYNQETDKAEPIEDLIKIFEQSGNQSVRAVCDEDTPSFTAQEWQNFSEEEKYKITLKYRLTYLADTFVNWCPALGTVLANDEIKDGVSERGGYPVERKKMKQWMMRITAYAERLLNGLDEIDWSDSLKDMQRNWIGKSYGAELNFSLPPAPSEGGGVSMIDSANQSKNTILAWKTAHPEKWELLKEFAKNHKQNPTEAENILWQALRNKQLDIKFRRQHTITDFIVDFVCLPKRLVIEIDGEIHQKPENQEYDNIRTEILEELGFKVIRFNNAEVINDLDNVLSKIKAELDNLPDLREENQETPPPSEGAGGRHLTVFTTRPDTTYGVTFVSIAPEHELIPQLTTPEQKQAVDEYVSTAKNRSERERQADTKTVSGVFTGSYVLNPFSGEKVPLWIADYVLAGYGTGVVMAVPSSDDRDFRFAKHFNLPIIPVIEGTEDLENPTEKKKGIMINSGFMNGMDSDTAIQAAIQKIENEGLGKGKVNFRLRDAVFSRQRYWGEPVPVYFKNGLPYLIEESELPLVLPEINEYKPTEDGEPPLARAKDWKYKAKPHPQPLSEGEGGDISPSFGGGWGDAYDYEHTTMPGWAGSSWYFLRYMDAQNEQELVNRSLSDYWQQVDFYLGGTEHAVGHLLYSRFWTQFLYDLGVISFKEPFKKLVNQGMIQGQSALMYRVKNEEKFVSYGLKDQYETTELHVDVNIVENNVLDIEAFKKWRPESANAEFILEDGKYICGSQVEKMSKRWYNVVNPDDVVAKYSADTFRLYEMFLGPLEQSKPWNTQGIDGTHRFLKKLWRLFYDDKGNFVVSEDAPTAAELKTLHKTIKGVEEDIERISFNTVVSKLMVCVNELTEQKCHKRLILSDLLLVIAPYAPHITEELWHQLGNTGSIHHATFPVWQAEYLVENTFEYPIQINGKLRANMSFALDMPQNEIISAVMANETVQKWLEGKEPKKIIVVPKKIINVVI